jgi:hypothetical protein
MAEKKDGAALTEGARVTAVPAATQTLVIRCSECGTEVDRVKYTPAEGPPPAVATVAAALGLSEADAEKLVKKENPEALRSSEEAARALADDIAARDVEDRAADTYACPNGHDADLEVTE